MRELSFSELAEYEMFLQLRERMKVEALLLESLGMEISQEMTDIIEYKGIYARYKCESYSIQYEQLVQKFNN